MSFHINYFLYIIGCIRLHFIGSYVLHMFNLIITLCRLLFETFPQGYGGRWAFGTVILIYLIAYNESCGPTVIFSTILAAFYSIFSATCKSAVKHLQIPYIRASNKFDFTCLFLAIWMDILTILTACGALARTLSICLDAMTGGLARILILGRNSPAFEPWPDVIGVSVVFLVTGMFMLGLENTRIFGIVMMFGVFGINVILTVVSWTNGNNEEWNKDFLRPDGIRSFFTTAALIAFSYPSELSNKLQGWKRLIGFLLVFIICLSMILACLCLSMIIHQKSNTEYVAAPIFTVLEENNYHKLIPAIACLLLLACSGAFLEFFPELYNIIVRLATSEWKILVKQISYESPDSGNPVLAVFVAGSLCAMLTFACPMQILTHMLAASHFCSGLFRAFYLLYTPFRPKFIQQSNESSLSYSRLSTAPSEPSKSSKRRQNWNFHNPIQSAMKKSKSIKSLKSLKKNKKEVEKEWLLLGEPSSPRPIQPEQNAESTVFSDIEAPMSDDNECVTAQLENTDSDTSTDIDAIVDEYRQKIKVTTAGPMETSVRVPSIASWRVTIFAILVIFFGIGLTVSGLTFEIVPAYITGLVGILFVSIMMSFIPKYSGSVTNISPIICTITLTFGTLLLSFCLALSWPAIIFWIIAGLMLILRCDKWCCTCLDQTSSDTQQIISSISGKTTTAIRIPRPPKGFIIPGKIQGHHNHRRR